MKFAQTFGFGRTWSSHSCFCVLLASLQTQLRPEQQKELQEIRDAIEKAVRAYQFGKAHENARKTLFITEDLEINVAVFCLRRQN